MKYRWKLLILLLVISIIPIVSLRTFGIHSVRNMADVVKEQVRQLQREEAENRLQLILNRFSEAMGKIAIRWKWLLFSRHPKSIAT